MTLDHLWWRIRDHLDGYLEVADSEVRHIQQSFVALSNYENCQAFMKGQKNRAGNMGQVLKSILGPQEIFKEFIFSIFMAFFEWYTNLQLMVDPHPLR